MKPITYLLLTIILLLIAGEKIGKVCPDCIQVVWLIPCILIDIQLSNSEISELTWLDSCC